MSRLFVYLVVAIFCITKTLAQSESFYFIQLSDPQFGMKKIRVSLKRQ